MGINIPQQAPFQNFLLGRDDQTLARSFQEGNQVQTQLTSTPGQRLRREGFTSLFSNILPQIQQTPEGRQRQIEEFGQAVFGEITTPLREQREESLLQAREGFGRRGLADSTSLSDFQRQNIDRTFQRGLVDAGVQKIFARENLAAQNEQRLLNLLNTATGGLQTDISESLNIGEAARGGLTTANQIQSNRFRNELARSQLQLQQQQQQLLAAQQAQQGGRGGGGFGGLGSLLGGIAGTSLLGPGGGTALGTGLGGLVGGLF